MKFRQLYFWIFLAAGLFAFIYFFQRHAGTPHGGPALVLPNLDPAAVTAVSVRPTGTNQLEIRAVRTNDTWRLLEPINYPAQAALVESLLTRLKSLTPATVISPAELRKHPMADEEYGFVSPQVATVIIQQGDYRLHLQVGRKTNPGDQLFLQLVGGEGAYVVDADLLNFIPRSVNDWRDTSVISLKSLAFDRIVLTNKAKPFELQRDAATRLWRITWPTQARADSAKIEDALGRLASLKAEQFITDDPRADLESYGLLAPDLQIALAQGTNTLLSLFVGHSPTNQPNRAYAKLAGQHTIIKIDSQLVDPWRRASVNDLRDPHLLSITAPVDAIDIAGEESFTLKHGTNDTWRILPFDWPADPAAVKDLIATLGSLEIVSFVKDVVPEPDLPAYGLAAPSRRFVLKFAAPPAPAISTNDLVTELDFGTNQEDKVFVRRTDENSVYAIALRDLDRLPRMAWQVRDRRLWNFSPEDVSSITIQQQGRTRRIDRQGPHDWALAPGSQGVINDLAIEETVRGLCQLSAGSWLASGDDARARFGFTNITYQLTLDLNDGQKAAVAFGAEAPSTFPYAGVTLGGRFYVFEFPWPLFRDVVSYLSVPVTP